MAVGLWLAAMLLIASLCHASTRSDDAMHTPSVDAAAVEGDADGLAVRPCERTLRTLGLEDAARLLGVTPCTLLEWDRRYGFPTSSATDQRYNRSEVLALRDNLADGLSIASAMNRARERGKRRRPAPAARLADHRDGGLAS